MDGKVSTPSRRFPSEQSGQLQARLEDTRDRWMLEHAFEHAPHFMALLEGPDHRVVHCNDAFRRLAGDRNVLGQPFAQALPELVALGYMAKLAEVFTQGKPFRDTAVRCSLMRHGDDPRQQRFVDFAGKPVFDAASGTRAIFLEGSDTTERTLAEIRLRESEERLREANDQLNEEIALRRADRDRLDLALGAAGIIGLWDGDLVGRRVYADANFARIYGVDPQAAIAGQPSGHYFDAIHPDDRAESARIFEATIAGGGDYVHEHRILRPDGTIRWVMARGRVQRDAAGMPIRFAGLSLDQTERKRAEARQAFLLALSDRLRTMTDSRAILVSAATALGEFLGANRVGYGQLRPDGNVISLLSGYAQGLPPLEGDYPIGALGAGNLVRLRQGITVACDDLLLDADTNAETGALSGARGHVVVAMLRENQYRGALFVSYAVPHRWAPEDISVIEDVSARIWDALERARAERDLRAANAQLEDRVAAAFVERSRMENALRQSQKMEAVGQLTGGIAHDFNNLLTGIAGSLELLKNRLDQGRVADADRYITAAQNAASRAASLTHRLLAFSRQQNLDPKPTEANRLISGMADLVQRTVGPEIQVETVLAGRLWPILCDPNQLENAILNLSINARDAMPDGGHLTIETSNLSLDERAAIERDVAAGDYVAIRVTDTGSGMPPDVAARAFDPFFTTKPIGMGTGLGLSMIYGFVKQSEGQVNIHTMPGHGTTVKIILPRAHSDVPAESEPPVLAAAPRARAGQTVLVVDDEHTVRMLVAEILEELGYATLEAEDGAAGLNLLKTAERVDLLITDVGLPGGMNGRQLAEMCRGTHPALKVLFITGYAEKAMLRQGSLAPGMHILNKPFALETLATRIRMILGEE